MVSFDCYRHDVKGSISETLDEDEEILGSDDDEQEDPRDYTKGTAPNKMQRPKDSVFFLNFLPFLMLNGVQCSVGRISSINISEFFFFSFSPSIAHILSVCSDDST